jgi:SAM-dependent methyltransferase
MSIYIKGTLAAFVLTCTSLASVGAALAKDRAECERVYRPKFGQPGKDVAWEPTTNALAADMLKLAKTTSRDRVYDLGAGDGAIVIVAAKQFGATSVGIEYNPDLAKLGQCFVEADGVANKAKVIEGDIFKTDFSSATVITLFLVPELNLRLRPTILNFPPGTRVVSHMHKMYEWNWDDEVERDGEHARLWIVPAKVQGTWEFKENKGDGSFKLVLKQQFQVLTGELNLSGQPSAVTGMMRGAEITVDFGGQRKLVGKADNKQIVASVTDARGAKEYVGTLVPNK